jgi:GT2 family glycosyltransferase
MSVQYRNQARPLNVGIRAAKGDVIILQNAECKHMSPSVVNDLVSQATDSNCVFARVIQINQDGSRGQVYCGEENPRPYFFCGAIRREHFLKLRGFDEDYQGYGYEDDDMADRLHRSGVEFEFTDIEVHHQWHEPAGVIDPDMRAGKEMFEWKKSTDVVRNLGREWGAL